ncbi:MAG: cation transporter [Acidobacteria bacterium]|nr:cation transporter [Acidobacteriota bacterium]
MNEKFLSIGSTVAAFVASLCCLGPLVLGSVGLGAALVATVAPLRPYFLASSAILLGLGFYFVYRKPRNVPTCAGEVCAPQSRTRRLATPLLWLATAAVAALAFFPAYGGKLVRPARVTPAAATVQLATVELKISGMTCEACAGIVKRKLIGTAGVAGAELDYPGGRATVKYDPTRTGPSGLVAAVNTTGYKASLPDSRGE